MDRTNLHRKGKKNKKYSIINVIVRILQRANAEMNKYSARWGLLHINIGIKKRRKQNVSKKQI